MADYIRKQLDVDGSYVFPYTHADAVLYTTQNNLDGITSGTETNVKAVLDALDNTYRRQDTNITSLYNSQGKRGFLYQNGTTTTASMELPTQGNDFYVPTLKYDSNGNITTAWQTPASIAAAADLSGYLPLTGGTLTGDITVNKSSYTVLTGNAVVNGLTAKANNITIGFGIGTGGVSRGIYDYNNSKWLIYSDGTNTNLPLGNVNISGDTKVTGKVMVGTGGTNSYLASDSANNIYLRNSSGAVLVCDSLAVRRGASVANATLGNSTYPWLALYATTIYENGTSLASKYVTLATDQSITGEKTFTGDKRIKFKQAAASNKLGFTLYNSSNIEVGFLEWQSNSLNSKPGLMLGQWVSTNNSATPGYLGFKVVDVTTAARYALVTPLLANAKTPLSLNNTIKTFYFPLQFKNGSTTTLTASSGVVDLSTLIPSYSTQNMSVNGTNYALYTSASSLPTIIAPTAYAGTGGYILATNTNKNGLEWVAKPTSNVSTSAVVSSSASGTTQISAAQSDPYYNLIEGSTVARSIRFVAGTGISISAATDGQITITNTAGGGGSTTVSSILSSTSTGTSAISGDTLDPYYNLLVNSAVSSSVQFKAGNNISVTAGTDNSITFSNTLTNMSQLTNNLFINGTQTATTNSWKGKLPAEITALYNGLTIFYRLPYAGNSSNASLQLYAQDGTTTIGANCPVYGGNTRLTTHYPQYSIIRMTYYNGEWRANPYYNTNNSVTQTNSATNDYRPILLGSQSNATYTAIPTTAVTNSTYKSSNLVYSPNNGRMYMTGTTADANHGYYVKYSTTAFLGLCIGTDGVQIGLRDAKNGKWLCYCDDTTGDSLKVPGTLIPQVINLAEHCQIAYDSTNQCINFTFT